MKSLARRLREREQAIAAKDPFDRKVFRASRLREAKPRDIAPSYWVSHILKINEQPDSAASKRVVRFIELFKFARELNDSFRLLFQTEEEMMTFLANRHGEYVFESESSTATRCRFKNPYMQTLNEHLNKVLGELNRLLRRYKVYPYVRHGGFQFSHFDVTEDWDSRGSERGWETGAVWWLQRGRGRWIDYFRRCGECNRWFFALAEHQSYCDEGCRKRHASHSDEFKERRALYMQGYRRREAEREKRAQSLARAERSGKTTRRAANKGDHHVHL